MPDLSDFLAGFGLTRGSSVGSLKIDRVFGSHQQIIRYKKYEYPIELTVETNGATTQEIVKAFNSSVPGVKTINSRYGNPYSCEIGKISSSNVKIHSGNIATINFTGHSTRI